MSYLEQTNQHKRIGCTMGLMVEHPTRNYPLPIQNRNAQQKHTTLSIMNRQEQYNKVARVINTTSSWFFVIGVLLMVNLLPILSMSVGVSAASISEGYPSDESHPEGSLVVLSNTTPPTVELADLNNSQYLVGVIENDGKSLVTFNKDGADLLVSTSGEVYAYVSDLAGNITAGDFIGTSWISGVGMKAESITEQKLLGIALEVFDENSQAIEIADVETADGNKTARVGKIAVRLFEREIGPDEGSQPSSLERLALRIAGKDVPFARVIAAFGLFTISVIISGVFLANAIKSSLISIGRNPLAHSPIFNTLTQISGVSIGLVLIGAALAYVVLIL